MAACSEVVKPKLSSSKQSNKNCEDVMNSSSNRELNSTGRRKKVSERAGNGSRHRAVTIQQLVKVFVQYFFNKDERLYFQQFWISLQDSKDFITLQDLYKILGRWLQLDISQQIYAEFLDLSGILVARSGDRLLELSREKISFSEVHRAAALLSGIKCHDRSCEQNNSSLSFSSGVREATPSLSDHQSMEGIAGSPSEKVQDKSGVQPQANTSLKNIKAEMKGFLRRRLNKALAQRGISPSTSFSNTSNVATSTTSTSRNMKKTSPSNTKAPVRSKIVPRTKTRLNSDRQHSTTSPSNHSFLPTDERIPKYDPSDFVSESQRRFANVLYHPTAPQFPSDDEDADEEENVSMAAFRIDKNSMKKCQRRKSFHTSSPKDLSGEGTSSQSFHCKRRNSAPCVGGIDEALFDGPKNLIDDEVMSEVRRYIDRQLDRVIQDTLLQGQGKQKKVSGVSKNRRGRDNNRDLVEDLSLFSMDNGPNGKPLVDVPVLHLRNTSSEDSEDWKTKTSYTSQWNTKSVVSSTPLAPYADRSDPLTYQHKLNPALFSPIYESLSIETQDEQSSNSSPKLAFVTAHKIYYDPESPPSVDKLKLLKVKSESHQQSAAAEIFKRKKRLCKTIYKVVSRSKSASRVRDGESTTSKGDEPVRTKNVQKRRSRSTSSDEDMVRNAARFSGERPKVAQTMSSQQYQGSRSENCGSKSGNNHGAKKCDRRNTSIDEEGDSTISVSTLPKHLESSSLPHQPLRPTQMTLHQPSTQSSPPPAVQNRSPAMPTEVNLPTPSFILDFSSTSNFSEASLENSTPTFASAKNFHSSPILKSANNLSFREAVASENNCMSDIQQHDLTGKVGAPIHGRVLNGPSLISLDEFCSAEQLNLGAQLKNKCELQMFLDSAKKAETLLVECSPSVEDTAFFLNFGSGIFYHSFEIVDRSFLVHFSLELSTLQRCVWSKLPMALTKFSSTFMHNFDVADALDLSCVEEKTPVDAPNPSTLLSVQSEVELQRPMELSFLCTKVPEVDVDLESFSDSSGDCQRLGQSKHTIQALQRLLDDLPLDCSTPKGKLGSSKAGDSNSGDKLEAKSTNHGDQLTPSRVIQVKSAVGCDAGGKELSFDLESKSLSLKSSKTGVESPKKLPCPKIEEENESSYDKTYSDEDWDDFQSFSSSGESEYISPRSQQSSRKPSLTNSTISVDAGKQGKTGELVENRNQQSIVDQFNKLPRDSTFMFEKKQSLDSDGNKSNSTPVPDTETYTIVNVKSASGIFSPGGVRRSTPETSLSDLSKVKEDYESLRQALEGVVSQEASFNVDDKVASMPERASRKITPKRLSMSDYIERLNTATSTVSGGRSVEPPCDSSGDNNEASFRSAALNALTADALEKAAFKLNSLREGHPRSHSHVAAIRAKIEAAERKRGDFKVTHVPRKPVFDRCSKKVPGPADNWQRELAQDRSQDPQFCLTTGVSRVSLKDLESRSRVAMHSTQCPYQRQACPLKNKHQTKEHPPMHFSGSATDNSRAYSSSQ